MREEKSLRTPEMLSISGGVCDVWCYFPPSVRLGEKPFPTYVPPGTIEVCRGLCEWSGAEGDALSRFSAPLENPAVLFTL